MLAVSTASDFVKGKIIARNPVQAYASTYPPSAAAATREVTGIQVVVDDFDRRALEGKDMTFWAPDMEAK